MEEILNKKIARLILKTDDVLVVHLPDTLFFNTNAKKNVAIIQQQLRKSLLPRKNKILIIPESFKLSVIGSDEIKEYISQIDLWNLFDEDGEIDELLPNV